VAVGDDDAGDDRFSRDAYPLRTVWNLGRVRGSDGLDPAVPHHEHAICDRVTTRPVDDRRSHKGLEALLRRHAGLLASDGSGQQ
jgi:hypothetical protein